MLSRSDQGNLVGRIIGTDAKAPAILLVAHIDVVEAKRSDWQRDPFKLVEENGYFYARGAIDDKAMAASFVDALIRYREENFRPRRTIKLALTCGEETDSHFDGVEYLLKTDPETLKAAFALNEGGKGLLDDAGKPMSFGVQTGEKVYQDFTLTDVAPGGHSARPTDDNAIVRLAAALGADRGNITSRSMSLMAARASSPGPHHPMPGRSAPTWRGRRRHRRCGNLCAYRRRFALLERVPPHDLHFDADPGRSCPKTPSRNMRQANVNCRIMPGEDIAAVERQLVEQVADPKVALKPAAAPGPQSPAPPLTRALMNPIEKIAAEIWPGLPVIPTLSTGATDGRFLNAAGIPTYGVSGVFVDPDGNGVHGLNERVRVKSLYDAREFLYRLVKTYGSAR
jgi:acetylornithine deacetylase/succinyl-diaminopimelate desuccinylase-like protein